MTTTVCPLCHTESLQAEGCSACDHCGLLWTEARFVSAESLATMTRLAPALGPLPRPHPAHMAHVRQN